ncbi:MAG: Lrp/AsnC family transcriptional regulator [Deinococcota bacterium]|jgi:Lrp/AsnC family transcriptional regulator for asnA, asnC and gidA|nr:Lrp/AsnC family transcriptional regulator [Deinococcota bacterium]
MKLDALDQRIIIALEDDGRKPFREIGRELGVAEATVRTRVNRLLEAGLIHITAVGDPLKLGVEVMALVLIKVRPGAVQETAEALAGYSNVRFVATSFGSADIIIQTLHPHLQSLHTFVSQELPRAAPHITNTETFQLAQKVKSTWNWRTWFEQQGSLGEVQHA